MIFRGLNNLYNLEYEDLISKFKIRMEDKMGYKYKYTLSDNDIVNVEFIFKTPISILFEKCFKYNHLYKWDININYINKTIELDIVDMLSDAKYKFILNEIDTNVDRVIKLESKIKNLKLRLRKLENVVNNYLKQNTQLIL
jgi:hypothetical protein